MAETSILTLDAVPSEVLHLALLTLPPPALLSFALTSRSNYEAASQAMQTLEISVLPRKIHTVLAFLNFTTSFDSPSTRSGEESDNAGSFWRFGASTGLETSNPHQIALTSPYEATMKTKIKRMREEGQDRFRSVRRSSVSPPAARAQQIQLQNDIVLQALKSPFLKQLRNLTLHIYDISSVPLAQTVATTLPFLHNLRLNFNHPYIHDQYLPTNYWRAVPCGSPVWNEFGAIKSTPNSPPSTKTARKLLSSLRYLELSRCGATSMQLRRWIEQNPGLQSLRLRNVRGVEAEFVQWLAQYVSSGRKGLNEIVLEDCQNLILKSLKDLEWINDIARSQTVGTLSLKGCKDVDADLLEKKAKGDEFDFGRKWAEGIPNLVSPSGKILHPGEVASTKSAATCWEDLASGIPSPSLSLNEEGLGLFGKASALIEVDPSCL